MARHEGGEWPTGKRGLQIAMGGGDGGGGPTRRIGGGGTGGSGEDRRTGEDWPTRKRKVPAGVNPRGVNKGKGKAICYQLGPRGALVGNKGSKGQDNIRRAIALSRAFLRFSFNVHFRFLQTAFALRKQTNAPAWLSTLDARPSFRPSFHGIQFQFSASLHFSNLLPRIPKTGFFHSLFEIQLRFLDGHAFGLGFHASNSPFD
jgi:hypothetical protein